MRAESAIDTFCATQGWALAVRKTRTTLYKYQDEEGKDQVAKLTKAKHWICSKGHHSEPNHQHDCGLNSAAYAESLSYRYRIKHNAGNMAVAGQRETMREIVPSSCRGRGGKILPVAHS
jgi:hypothetical protein